MTAKTAKSKQQLQREADDFICRHFPDLSCACAACYFVALPRFERNKNIGFGGWIKVPFDVWTEKGFQSKNTVMGSLKRLRNLGLIELIPGNSKKRIPTHIRRRTVEEIISSVSREVLERFVPGKAEAIAGRLQKIGLLLDGKIVYPKYNAVNTGRIYMSKPSLQNKPEEVREMKLGETLRPGEAMCQLDYSQAEPTILFSELTKHGGVEGFRPKDVYQDLASIRQVDRATAKYDLLFVFYSPLTKIMAPDHWNLPQGHYIHRLIAEVNDYRNLLWQTTKPKGRECRKVHTITGRPIVKSPHESMHRGKLLAWRLQGSLADIFNNALARCLDGHDAGQWRVLLQVHDSIYVAGDPDTAHAVIQIMEEAARETGIMIEAKHKPDNTHTNWQHTEPTVIMAQN